MKRWFVSYSYKDAETLGFSCYCCRIIEAETSAQAEQILRHTEVAEEFKHIIIRSTR